MQLVRRSAGAGGGSDRVLHLDAPEGMPRLPMGLLRSHEEQEQGLVSHDRFGVAGTVLRLDRQGPQFSPTTKSECSQGIGQTRAFLTSLICASCDEVSRPFAQE